MPDREKPSREGSHDPETEPTESAEPLNRAERRALRRGKKQAAPPAGGRGGPQGHHEQVLVPRRSGRRGNR
jgi:hypothetical protein